MIITVVLTVHFAPTFTFLLYKILHAELLLETECFDTIIDCQFHSTYMQIASELGHREQ